MMLIATTVPTLIPERPARLALADVMRRAWPGPQDVRSEDLRLALAKGGRRNCAVPTAVFVNRLGAIRISTTLVRFRSLSVIPEDFFAILERELKAA
jgi:hypothetical protein